MPASCSATPGPGDAEPKLDPGSGEPSCVTWRMLREVGAFLLSGMAAMPCAWSSPELSARRASLITASSLEPGLCLSAFRTHNSGCLVTCDTQALLHQPIWVIITTNMVRARSSLVKCVRSPKRCHKNCDTCHSPKSLLCNSQEVWQWSTHEPAGPGSE